LINQEKFKTGDTVEKLRFIVNYNYNSDLATNVRSIEHTLNRFLGSKSKQ